MSNYPIVQPFSPATRLRMALAVLFDRLAFVGLCLLALTFAFEIPLGSTLADAAVTNVKLLQIGVIGCWILSRAASGVWPRFPRSLALPVIGWLAVLVISTLLAPDYLTHTIRFMSRITQGLLLAWVAYDLVDSAPRWQMVVRALAIAGLVVAGLGLAEAANISPVVNLLSLFHPAQIHVGDLLRVSASLEYATIAAMVLEMLIPLLVAWAITIPRQSHILRLALMLGVVMSITTLVLTLTRSAVLGLIVSLLIMSGISFWYRQRLIALTAIGALLATAAVIGLLVLTNRTVGLRLLTESENGWYLARYAAPTALSARPNELLNVPIQVTNAGLRTWQAAADPPFRLGYTLVRENDRTAKGLDGIRAALPADVPPGQTLSIMARVPAPGMQGQYVIEWDMVQETVLWFSWRGSPLGTTRLTVAGTPVTNAQRLQLPPANHSTASPPVERPALWGAALRMVRDHPLFGVGPDDFRWMYGRYLALDHWDTNIHANSIYFEFLADTGVIGLLAFLWLNWRLVRLVWQRFRAQPDHDIWIWQLALFASLIAWFVHGFFDYFYEFAGTYVLFWLIAGLAANRVMAHLPRETGLQEA